MILESFKVLKIYYKNNRPKYKKIILEGVEETVPQKSIAVQENSK